MSRKIKFILIFLISIIFLILILLVIELISRQNIQYVRVPAHINLDTSKYLIFKESSFKSSPFPAKTIFYIEK